MTDQITTALARTNRIMELNDIFRRTGPGPGWMITRGVADRGPAFQLAASLTVRDFSTFDEDNDPYGEHDFGNFRLHGEKLFWKIDYHDVAEQMGSPDPSDPSVTHRVLTIMLASEY